MPEYLRPPAEADQWKAALLAVLDQHEHDPATVRTIADKLGIEVDRG